MKFEQRKKIAAALKNRMEQKGLENTKVSISLGISESYVSQLTNINHPNFKERIMKFGPTTLNKIAAWLDKTGKWSLVETNNYITIYNICTEAKENKGAYWFVGKQGCGKTQTLKKYASETRETWYVHCRQSWSIKDLFISLLNALGASMTVGSTSKLEDNVIDILRGQNSPLIIFDEIEVLDETIFPIINDIYNCLENNCGIVVSGTPALLDRVKKGGGKGCVGYLNFFSRFGGEPTVLKPPLKKELKEVCIANGVADTEEVNLIVDLCCGDLRRMARRINNNKRAKKNKELAAAKLNQQS